MLEFVDPQNTQRFGPEDGSSSILSFVLTRFSAYFLAAYSVLLLFLFGTGSSFIAGIAMFLAILNLGPEIADMMINTREESRARVQDRMWIESHSTDSVFLRELGRGYFYLIMDIIFLGPMAIISAVAVYYVVEILQMFIDVPMPTDFQLWMTGAALALMLVLRIFVWTRKKERRNQEEQAVIAERALLFRADVTVAIPGFVGLKNGEVYSEETGALLRIRPVPVIALIYNEPYLLVQDEDKDVVLWKQKGSHWKYLGFMSWVDDGTLSFGPRDEQRNFGAGGHAGVIRQFGDIIGFKSLSTTYFTDTIGERMVLRSYADPQIFDFATADGTYYLLKKDIIGNYHLLMDGVVKGMIDLGLFDSDERTKHIVLGEKLWLIMNDKILEFTLPSGEGLESYSTYKNMSIKPVPAEGDLMIYYYSSESPNPGILMISPTSDVVYILRNEIDQVFYSDGDYVSFSMRNAYFKVHISSLKSAPR